LLYGLADWLANRLARLTGRLVCAGRSTWRLAWICANTTTLASLDKVSRHPAKLCKAGLAVPDIIDYALQGVSMLLEDGVDDVA
jgi:hypothetical protein